MKKLLLALLILFQSTYCFCAEFPTLPYTFVAQQLISASKVMANYNALKNALVDGTKKINIAELWINGTKIIDSSGSVTSYYLDVVNKYSSDIDAAITAASSEGKYTLLFVSPVTLTQSVNIPATIDLKFIDIGAITANFTVTLNGQNIIAPPDIQLFGSSTTINGTIANPDVFVDWFGAIRDDSLDDVPSIKKAFDFANSNDCNLMFLSGTYDCDNLDFIGATNITIKGVWGSVLDFNLVTSGDGLTIGYSNDVGGSKHVTLENLVIKDTSTTSNVTNLLVIQGGKTGETPSRTSAYINLKEMRLGPFASQTGTAILVDNISHMEWASVYTTNPIECKYGLYITNSIDINTGVFTFVNCEFRAGHIPLYIYAQNQLIDTVDFIGCGIFNSTSGFNPQESIYIDATAQMSAVNFYGCHVENRSVSEVAAITITGNYFSSDWKANHISCGTGSDYTDIGILMGGGGFKAVSFKNNEFLRVQGTPTGSCFYFADTITVDKRNPIEIGGVWKAITSPDTIQIASGATQDITRKAIVSYPNTTDQTGLDYVYDLSPTNDTTPDVSGISKLDINDPLIITNFSNGIEGQRLWVYSSTDNVVITHNASIANLGDTPVTINAGENAQYIKRGLWRQISQGKYGFSAGNTGIGAASSTVVYDIHVKSTSFIVIQGSNASGAGLMGSAKSLYVSNIVPYVSFTLTTADGNNAVGTETFDYLIINK
jgi:hypothetical protein